MFKLVFYKQKSQLINLAAI